MRHNRSNKGDTLRNFALDHRQSLRRIPDLLAHGSDEAQAMSQLNILLFGSPTSELPQCSVLLQPCSATGCATAMFLGGKWALTALHALESKGCPYVVSLPITAVADIRKTNMFEVNPIPAPNPTGIEADQPDLALLELDGMPEVGALKLANEDDLRQAGAVQLCGFGSDNCDIPTNAGVKRLSDACPILENPAASGINIDPATQFIVQNPGSAPLVCKSDSGGGAVIPLGSGAFKLAGIIIDEVVSSITGAPIGVKCVRLSAFSTWIQNVIGSRLGARVLLHEPGRGR